MRRCEFLRVRRIGVLMGFAEGDLSRFSFSGRANP